MSQSQEAGDHRLYLDHYGQDLRHVPKTRVIEILRMAQEHCEKLESENEQLQACIEALREANRRETEQQEESSSHFHVSLPSAQIAVDLASLEGVQALLEELSNETGEVCSAAIAASGFSALEFLAKRLGQMHQQGGGERGEGGRREDSDENLEEHEARQRELRELQVGSIRAMLLVGEKHPKVFSMLGQSLAKWLSPDLTSRDDPERIFYDLTVLAKICSKDLPPYAKGTALPRARQGSIRS